MFDRAASYFFFFVISNSQEGLWHHTAAYRSVLVLHQTAAEKQAHAYHFFSQRVWGHAHFKMG